MIRQLIILLFLLVSTAGVAEEIVYRVGAVTGSDFFAYDRASNTVEFFERSISRQPTGSLKTLTVANFYVNLKEKKVIRQLRGKERMSGCFSGRLIRQPGGRLTVSANNNTDTFSLLDLETGECHQINHDYHVMKLAWSDDGRWLEMMERKDVAFYRMDPKKLQFERLERKGAIASIAWSPTLNRSLYVYRTKPVDTINKSNEGYDYYYVDDEGVQRKVEEDYPLTNPKGDVYFYASYEDEESPTTIFVDAKSGNIIARQSDFYLGFYNRYAIWLKNNWVYFEGAGGVLNYRTGEFVSFGTELTKSVVPFSVSEQRYALMYLQGEDRLMVYDLEKREYIESYKPFWREN